MLKKVKNNVNKNKIIRDIRSLFESDEDPIYLLWTKYIGYEREGDKTKTLSIETYLNKIKHYLSNKINNLKSHIKQKWKWKISINNSN